MTAVERKLMVNLPEDRYSVLMTAALEEAKKAACEGEVPIGAVVALGDRIISRGHNRVVQDKDPTAHAEMIVLQKAAAAMGNERLVGLDLVVTLEPCPMCLGAAILARVDRVVFGASDPKSGAAGSRFDLLAVQGWNHYPECVGGIKFEEAGHLLTQFFQRKRRDGREVEGG